MLARHYISLSQTIPFSHIGNYQISITSNLNDSSLLLTNSFSHRIYDNLEIRGISFTPLVLNRSINKSLSEFGKVKPTGTIGFKFYW